MTKEVGRASVRQACGAKGLPPNPPVCLEGRVIDLTLRSRVPGTFGGQCTVGPVFVPRGHHPCTSEPLRYSLCVPPLVDPLLLAEYGDGVSGLRVCIRFLGLP